MANQNQNQTQKGSHQDQNSEPLKDIQQGFNSGYDAKVDETNGDQTADESEELTNVLNPIKPKPTPGGQVDQPNADPGGAQKKQAERGGS